MKKHIDWKRILIVLGIVIFLFLEVIISNHFFDPNFGYGEFLNCFMSSLMGFVIIGTSVVSLAGLVISLWFLIRMVIPAIFKWFYHNGAEEKDDKSLQ